MTPTPSEYAAVIADLLAAVRAVPDAYSACRNPSNREMVKAQDAITRAEYLQRDALAAYIAAHPPEVASSVADMSRADLHAKCAWLLASARAEAA